jgi:hypothetical protein
MYMPQSRLLAFILCVFLQGTIISPKMDGVFNPKEEAKMASAKNVKQRIKVYEAACKRYKQTLESAIIRDDYSHVSDDLKRWNMLLSASREDIDANLRTNKKSKELIRYEIELRKSLKAFQDYKVKVPIEYQDKVSLFLEQAEKIRKRFIEIIFQH